MLNKKITYRSLASFFVMVLLMASCKTQSEQEKLAAYVSGKENGLTKKQVMGDNEIVCQFVPVKKEGKESGGTGQLYRFMVYLNSKTLKMTDSLMYKFNYHSAELFHLVSGADTLKPVLSERIMNGRTDRNEFEVFFEPVGDPSNEVLKFLVDSNAITGSNIAFDYKYNDITKALKNLYGYDPVKN